MTDPSRSGAAAYSSASAGPAVASSGSGRWEATLRSLTACAGGSRSPDGGNVNCGIEGGGFGRARGSRGGCKTSHFGARSLRVRRFTPRGSRTSHPAAGPSGMRRFACSPTANVEIRPRTGTRSTFSSLTNENVERGPEHTPNSTIAAALANRAHVRIFPSKPQLSYTDAGTRSGRYVMPRRSSRESSARHERRTRTERSR
jgi:hypothetical protein